ncbi:hypothetical protein NQ318_015001 [Aromia moschata]|uniref:Uncharacterized protein n=1 Tax=Aromia moschata TaxID=1265417 RepID=A0AAV8YXB8_9CUCU|nr:hypothetical protein NQ318_015001 [Aromia moschata]
MEHNEQLPFLDVLVIRNSENKHLPRAGPELNPVQASGLRRNEPAAASTRKPSRSDAWERRVDAAS